jgi:hypothetical protein
VVNVHQLSVLLHRGAVAKEMIGYGAVEKRNDLQQPLFLSEIEELVNPRKNLANPHNIRVGEEWRSFPLASGKAILSDFVRLI